MNTDRCNPLYDSGLCPNGISELPGLVVYNKENSFFVIYARTWRFDGDAVQLYSDAVGKPHLVTDYAEAVKAKPRSMLEVARKRNEEFEAECAEFERSRKLYMQKLLATSTNVNDLRSVGMIAPELVTPDVVHRLSSTTVHSTTVAVVMHSKKLIDCVIDAINAHGTHYYSAKQVEALLSKLQGV